MKVWIVNHYALPPSEPGGTRDYTLSRYLTRMGHEVVLIAGNLNYLTHRPIAGSSAPGLQTVGQVPFLWLPVPGYARNGLRRVANMLAFAAQTWAGTAMRQIGKPDVIIGFSPDPFAALAAERLATRLRVPFVLQIGDVWPQTLIDLGGISARHPAVLLLGLLEKHLYRRAQHVISMLPGTAEHITACGGCSDKVTWIPNGVDLENIPAPQPPREDTVFTVMYAGAHGIANSLDTVLDAAGILQRQGCAEEIRFRFVGNGPERPRLESRARREGITMVQFEDSLPKRRVFNVLQQADAFIVTMRSISLYRYGISFNKLYDYLATARPVIFGTNACNDPVSEAGAGISVAPEDASAMACAVQQLARASPAERWAMGLRGRRYVEQHHDYALLAGQLERLLEEVVAKRHAVC